MELYLAEEQESLLPSRHKNSRNYLKDESTYETSLDSEDSPGFTLEAGKRPYRDTVFTYLFLGTILLTYGFGTFAFTGADFNLDFKSWHSRFNPAARQCEVLKGLHARGYADSMQTQLMFFLPICALLVASRVGIFLVWLVRRYTREVVKVANPLMTLVPVGLCIFWFTWCYGIDGVCAQELDVGVQVTSAVFLPAMTALSVFQLWKTWSRNTYEASFQLLKMATDALKQHDLLLVLQPALFLLTTLVLVNGPIFTFIWYALNNGRIVPKFDGVYVPALGYPSCVVQRPEWFIAYITLACFTAIWVFMVSLQLQIMVVSGTISQWYFAPAGTSTSGNIKRSLRIAFGSSFGTACNLGTIVTSLVVALLGLLKSVTNRVANCSRHGMISFITRGCLSWMFQFPECHSRFASNFATISGNSFWESSKMASSLLRRNSLCTTGKDFTLPTQRVLMGMTFIYSILQSLAVYGVLEFFLNTEAELNLLIAVNCFTAAVLGLTQVTLSVAAVIDTVYICYAMEKDTGIISKPEICQAYVMLHSEKEAVLAGAVAPHDKLSAP